MLLKCKNFLDNLEKNKTICVVFEMIFVLAIAGLSFCGAFRGLDVTDSTYSLSNFMFLDSLDGMWFYSTFYANLLGRLFIAIPLGQTLIGAKVLCSIIKFSLAMGAYLFFTYAVRINRFSKFLGVITSLGLCWCPETILYNYLTYLLFFLGAVILYVGLEKENKKYLLLAGFLLGSNVFVRLPNLVEAALIVALWADSFLKKEKIKNVLTKTMWCILGYFLAFVPAAVAMCLTRGIGAYFKGIIEMLSMSSEAEGYGFAEMILQTVRSYLFAKKFIFLLLLGIAANVLFYAVVKKLKKSENISIFVALGSSALLVVKYYRSGVFTTFYNRYDAFFSLGKIILFYIYVYMLAVLFDKRRTVSERRLAIMAIIIGLVTPLGTNNEVYANLNNMFFVLPVMWYFIGKDIIFGRYFKSANVFVSVLLLLLAVQSVLFGCTFSFRDGTDSPMNVKAYGNETVNGIKTSADNAASIAGVSEFWSLNDLNGEQVLLYGDVSGMAYILRTPVAISTAWPSLASFSTVKFEKDIDALSANNKTPSVLFDKKTYDSLCDAALAETLNNKQIILKKFLDNNKYTIAYQNDKFVVLLANVQ